MTYSEKEITMILDKCKNTQELESVYETVWQYPGDLVERHLIPWFNYRVRMRSNQV